MKKFNFQFSIILLLAILSFTSAFSQGTISGTVVDEGLGETIIGGNVVLKSDPSIGSSTDFDGKYTIKNIPAGSYTLVVSYVGFPNKEIPNVIVKDGEVTYQDVLMKEDGGIKLEGVEVVAKVIKTGENAILLSMLKAPNMTDGIGQREMQKLNISSADQAVAKVVGISVADGSVVVRGLGDRYSTAQLNGASIPSANPYKNSVNLDLIPSGLLSNVITSKTFTPDQPGTFTGGNVNLETKNFPEERSLQISVSSGYNTQSSLTNDFLTHDGGNLDWLGYDDGYRARASIFDDEKYADALLKSAAPKARSNDELAGQIEELSDASLSNMDAFNKKSSLNQGFGFSFGDNFNIGNRELGVILSANYSRSFRHFDSDLRNYALDNLSSGKLNQNFNLGGTTSIESPTVGGMVGLSYKISPRSTISFNTLYNHSADKSTRSYAGEYNTYQVTSPEIFEFRELYWLERTLLNNMLLGEHAFGAGNDIKLEWVMSASQATQSEPELRYFGNEFDIRDEDDPTDDRWAIRAPSEYDYPNHFFRDLKDNQIEGKVNLTLPILKNWTKGNKLKFGIASSVKERTFTEKRYSVQKNSATNYAGDPEFYFGDENSGLLEKDANDRNVLGNVLVDDSRPSNSYIGSEEIYASYAMVTLNPTSKFKIITGARYENATLPVTTGDSTSTAQKISFLPSVNLVYALRDKMNLRAAYSNTVARPNLRELAPFSNFDFRTGAFITGNPELEITSIQNMDLRWEWMPKAGEIVAVSAYLKSFKNPIVLVNLGKSNPEFQYQNVDQATVYGVELEYRKNLGFISPKLNNFKWAANFSYIYSTVDIEAEELARLLEVNPNVSSTRTFFNQSPFIINSNLIYSHPESKIDAALSYNVFGERLVIIGQEGTPDIFEQARPQLDFTISKKFGEKLSARFSAKNLLDPNYTLQSTFVDTDYIYSNYKLGRTFSMSLSYNIF